MKKKMLRLFALTLALCLLLSCVVMAAPETEEPVPEEPPVTDDIPDAEPPAEDGTEENPEETLPEKPEIEYVYPDDWSRDALVFAVENGILAGDENHNLNPQNNITRAEMAAVLVRLLGATESADLSSYQDVDPAAWYCKELSAAVAAGIFSGLSATEMQPNTHITREQAVVVLCRAFGLTSDDKAAYQDFTDYRKISGYARDCVSALKGMKLVNGYGDGTLFPQNPITRAEVAQLLYNIFDVIADSPEEIPESGWVLYRGSEVPPETLSLDGTLILGQNTPAALTASDWQISGALIVRMGRDADCDLSGLTSPKLVCAPLSGKLTANVDNVYFWSAGCEFEGSAKALTVVDGVHSFSGSCDSLDLRKGSFRLDCDITSVSLGSGTTLELNGTAQTVSIDGANATVTGSGHAAKVIINAGGYTIDISYDELDDIWYQTYQKDYENALSTVQTMRVACEVQKDTALYTNAGSGYICDVPAGTTVYNEWHPAGSWFYCSLEDGTKGWIPRWDCYIPDDTITTDGALDYSIPVKEGFVDLMGYASETEYLIWISRYTQKVIVYQGAQGDWNVIQTFPCSTGENNTPTPEGVYAIYADGGAWYYDDYYVVNVTLFSGSHAFHSILKGYGGSDYDGRVGIPLSHGCVRMLEADCAYISDLPVGTTVVVY